MPTRTHPPAAATLPQRAEDARRVADQLDEIRVRHARDCAESGVASPALVAAAERARAAYVVAERLEREICN